MDTGGKSNEERAMKKSLFAFATLTSGAIALSIHLASLEHPTAFPHSWRILPLRVLPGVHKHSIQLTHKTSGFLNLLF